MSYDLFFVPSRAGNDPDAIQAFLEDQGDDTWKPSREELASALQLLDPALERFEFDYEDIARLEGTSVEEARHRNSHIELNATEEHDGIQIILFSNHASITVPYWHAGPAAEGVFAKVTKYAQVLVTQGGYRIFDPQLDEILDDLAEIREEILVTYAGVTQRPPEIRGAASNKPWWRFW
jgi:hypothetical protein